MQVAAININKEGKYEVTITLPGSEPTVISTQGSFHKAATKLAAYIKGQQI